MIVQVHFHENKSFDGIGNQTHGLHTHVSFAGQWPFDRDLQLPDKSLSLSVYC